MYYRHDVKLSKNQIKKIRWGIEHDVAVTIRLGTGTIPTYLMLTDTDIKHLVKSSQIHLSKTQLKSNKHLLESEATSKAAVKFNPNLVTGVKDVGEDIKEQLNRYKQSLSLDELYEIMKLITDLLTLKEAPQEGENIFRLALPFIKQVLPKVLGTLGLAAASGAVSGATHKATSGGSIPYTKKDNKIMQDLCKDMEMEGGFIGTLLAGLAGSLLPSLLGGKGLYRAGVKLKKNR